MPESLNEHVAPHELRMLQGSNLLGVTTSFADNLRGDFELWTGVACAPRGWAPAEHPCAESMGISSQPALAVTDCIYLKALQRPMIFKAVFGIKRLRHKTVPAFGRKVPL